MTNFSGAHCHYSELPGLALTLTQCAGASVLPRHQHQEAFLSFVFKGAYEEGQGSRMQDCKENHITWHPQRDAHEVRHGEKEVTSLQITFESPVVEGINLRDAFARKRATAHVPGLRGVLNEARWELMRRRSVFCTQSESTGNAHAGWPGA